MLLCVFSYLIVAWAFGIYYVGLSQGHWNKFNIYLILFIAPFLLPIILALVVSFYILIGGLNFVEKLDSLRDRQSFY